MGNSPPPFLTLQALGTHWGAVHVLDFEGNVIKTFQKHSATVNDISIDAAGEYVASASDDGIITRTRATYRLFFFFNLQKY